MVFWWYKITFDYVHMPISRILNYMRLELKIEIGYLSSYHKIFRWCAILKYCLEINTNTYSTYILIIGLCIYILPMTSGRPKQIDLIIDILTNVYGCHPLAYIGLALAGK